MGQKVHPYGFRVGTLYGWQSNWFADKHYAEQLHEDIAVRKFIKKKLYHAGISKVVIERTGEKMVVNIHTARPGISDREARCGGRSASEGAEGLHQHRTSSSTSRRSGRRSWTLNSWPRTSRSSSNARVAFRRAMKKAMISTMKFGAEGIRIQCSGRLGGAEMGRREWYRDGRVPLHTLRAEIEYGLAEAQDHVRRDRREGAGYSSGEIGDKELRRGPSPTKPRPSSTGTRDRMSTKKVR